MITPFNKQYGGLPNVYLSPGLSSLFPYRIILDCNIIPSIFFDLEIISNKRPPT